MTGRTMREGDATVSWMEVVSVDDRVGAPFRDMATVATPAAEPA